MKKKISIITIVFMTFAISAQEPEGLKRFAIFAGSNDGGTDRVKLEYAETDALAMYNVFTEIGGLSPADTILLKEPSPRALESAFNTMKHMVETEGADARRTEFFFYYSGHSDETGILPGGAPFGYKKLREMINSMGTDVKIAVLDSCSSGAFTRLKGGIKKAPFMVDESVDTTGHAFLTSSSENEAAQESDSIEGSFFTHYLISALRGAGDSTQDGTVTLNEAYSFAADETLATTTSSIAGAQHPSYSINLTGSGDLVLTDLRETVASISLAKDIDGRIFFRDSSDRIVIEFRKRAGIPVSLSLPAGLYHVELESNKGLSSAEINVSKKGIVLQNSQFQPEMKSFSRIRGDSDNSSDSTEYDLEQKIKEIRGLIEQKMSDPQTEDDHDEATDESYSEISEPDYGFFGLYPTPLKSSSDDVRNIALNFIGKPYEINGLALGFMNMTYGDVHGVQVGALSNETGRDNYGLLVSGIYNIVNRNLWGTACSGIFNLTSGSTYGIQTAGIFNITKNFSYGGQIAGIFNIADKTLDGIQISGIINKAENVNGIQIGLINAGGIVNGMQIGLININNDINGLPIGLVTISRNGIKDFGGWYENSGFFYTGIQTGSKNFYNFGYVAFPVDSEDSVFVAGLGIGARINFTPFYIDLDTSIKSVSIGSNFGSAFTNTFTETHMKSLFPNVRISIGLKVFHIISLYGGMSVDLYIPGITERSEYFHNYPSPWIWKNTKNGNDILELHPKWYTGIKINL